MRYAVQENKNKSHNVPYEYNLMTGVHHAPLRSLTSDADFGTGRDKCEISNLYVLYLNYCATRSNLYDKTARPVHSEWLYLFNGNDGI